MYDNIHLAPKYRISKRLDIKTTTIVRIGPIFRTGFSMLSAKGFRWVGGSQNLSERIV